MIPQRCWRLLDRGHPGERSRRTWRGLLLEGLECRCLLSTIAWINRGSPSADTDNFDATYGHAADTARSVVDSAIQAWEAVIADFNYSDGGNTYSLSVSANDLGGGSRGATLTFGQDANGKPTNAAIQLDDDGG